MIAVTGGARGIGRATAEALVAAGARVAIGDLDGELAGATARELGGQVLARPLDVTDRASFTRFLDDVEEELGPLDVLVNNAGVMLIGEFAKEEDRVTDLQIDVNVRGVLLGMKLAVPRFRERGRGHIVNLASVAGKAGIPHGVTYSATKFAVVGATEALREELRGTGIAVSAIMPAAVNTQLGAGLHMTTVQMIEPSDVATAIVRVIRTRAPEVTVPRWLLGVQLAVGWLPARAKAAVGHAFGTDKGMTMADTTVRADYERRTRDTAGR